MSISDHADAALLRAAQHAAEDRRRRSPRRRPPPDGREEALSRPSWWPGSTAPRRRRGRAAVLRGALPEASRLSSLSRFASSPRQPTVVDLSSCSKEIGFASVDQRGAAPGRPGGRPGRRRGRRTSSFRLRPGCEILPASGGGAGARPSSVQVSPSAALASTPILGRGLDAPGVTLDNGIAVVVLSERSCRGYTVFEN